MARYASTTRRFDGTGYPDGRAGSGICRAARIVSIADSYEVMTAHRAYKKPMATVAARAELTRCAGTQFDPTYVRAFLAISLPRLFWAMGPGSLVMNIPLLRVVADSANKGALATAQSSVLTASAAVVISGVTAASAGHVPAQHHPGNNAAAPARHGSAVAPPAAGPAPAVGATPRRPTVKPVTRPGAVIPRQPAPAPAPEPVVTPPVVNTASVAFTWVPFPLIASTSASVGFTTNPATAAVMCSLDGAPETACAGTSVEYSDLSDGEHVIAVTALDDRGQPGVTISTAFAVDTNGATVRWTDTPPAGLASSTAVLRYVTDEPSAATWCSLDGAAASACSSPLSVTGLADGPHSVSVYTVDAVGNVGPAIQSTFTVDTTSPVVTITSAPAKTITTSTAALQYTLDDPAAAAWCSLDGAAPTPCTSPVTYSALADGPHDIGVYAVDSLGNIGPTVHSQFTVDTTGPVVTFTSAPTAIVPSHSVSVGFAVDDPNATAWCALDAGAASQCSSPVTYNGVPDGPHTVTVYAVDTAGNIGATIQSSFTVNATAPTVTLTSVPASISKNTTASVAFAVDDPSATAFCSLDGNAPAACTSPISYTDLSDGPHRVDVYATSLGNEQSATASASFTIDTLAPIITITSAPAATTTKANARLSFSVDDATATTWCSVDNASATACTSPLDLSGLAQGPHTVTLYATDPAGNISPTVQRGFTIDDTAPTTTFTSTPVRSASRTATATFTTNDPGATTWCRLDANAAQQCSDAVTYTGLTDGSHTISVYAVDQAGNRGATVSTTFTVSGAAPTLLTTPSAKSGNKHVTFTWIATPGMTYQYSYDGVTWAATTTFFSYTATLKKGTYTFRLRGVDRRGATTDAATFTFKIT